MQLTFAQYSCTFTQAFMPSECNNPTLSKSGRWYAPKSHNGGKPACRKIQTSMLKGTALFSTCRYDRHRMCQFSRLHFQAGWDLKALNVLMEEQYPGTHPGYQKGMHYIMQSHSQIMCVPYQDLEWDYHAHMGKPNTMFILSLQYLCTGELEPNGRLGTHAC